jgi:hypothetical protein
LITGLHKIQNFLQNEFQSDLLMFELMKYGLIILEVLVAIAKIIHLC